jgi:hypothetical protein
MENKQLNLIKKNSFGLSKNGRIICAIESSVIFGSAGFAIAVLLSLILNLTCFLTDWNSTIIVPAVVFPVMFVGVLLGLIFGLDSPSLIVWKFFKFDLESVRMYVAGEEERIFKIGCANCRRLEKIKNDNAEAGADEIKRLEQANDDNKSLLKDLWMAQNQIIRDLCKIN